MNTVKPDPNKVSIGNVCARDHVINQFLKNKPEGVAEISVNHTDSDGNVRQQKVGIDGSVTESRITKASDKSYYQALEKLKQHSCSKSSVSFSGACSKERWNEIFGKKEDKQDA